MSLAPHLTNIRGGKRYGLLPTAIECRVIQDIPFVSYIPFDFQDFEGFPARNGPTKADRKLDLDRAPGQQCVVSTILAFLWLLARFRGRSFNVHDFTRFTDDGYRVMLSLERLEEVEIELHGSEDHSWFESLRPWVDHAAAIAQEVGKHPNCSTPPTPAVSFSIKVLLLTLLSGIESNSNPEVQKRFIPLGYANVRSLDGGFIPPPVCSLIDPTLAAGWCPFQVHQLCRKFDYATVYFIARLERTQYQIKQHTQCSAQYCRARDIPVHEYRTQAYNTRLSMQLYRSSNATHHSYSTIWWYSGYSV